MNGLATNLAIEQLAPEVEAPRDDTFGLAAINRERQRAKLERLYSRIYKSAMLVVIALVAASAGYNARASGKPNLVCVCALDHAEKCLVCRFMDASGKVHHKHTHCPALDASGALAWPLEGNRE